MKKLLILSFLSICIIVLFSSCEKGQSDELLVHDSEMESLLHTILESEGNSIVQCHNLEERDSTSSIQERTNRKTLSYVSQTNHVRVNIGKTWPKSWNKFVKVAVYYMNNYTDGRLRYSWRKVYHDNVINKQIILYADLEVEKIGRGDYPSGGYPGERIRFNPIYYNNQSDKMKFLAVLHELGHTIGFMHTDGTNGVRVGPCRTNDPGSVMQERIKENLCNGYSSCDKKAYKAFY